MKLHIDVFYSFGFFLFGHCDNSLVILEYWNKAKYYWIRTVSHHAVHPELMQLLIATYSASVEDIATVACLFQTPDNCTAGHFQEISRNKHSIRFISSIVRIDEAFRRCLVSILDV